MSNNETAKELEMLRAEVAALSDARREAAAKRAMGAPVENPYLAKRHSV